MSIRITGGELRGRLIQGVPEGVRPTAGRVREALFSMVGQALQGWSALDAFGGTGLLAFEAASRGAAPVTVVELRRPVARQIVARAETRRKAEVLREVGASRVLEIEWEMGRRVAQDLVSPVASDLLDLAQTYRVTPWVAQGPIVGRTLAESGLRSEHRLNVLGIRPRSDGSARVRLAQPDHLIAEGDTLLLAGEEADVRRFFDTAGRETGDGR